MPLLCECGCGQRPKHETRKGKPVRFVVGHCGRAHPRTGRPDNYAVSGSGCWEWLGRLTPAGYGELTHRQHHVTAHVFQYEKRFGAIPAGMELDHLCRNRKCCNPDHLEAVPHATNMRRGSSAKLTSGEAREIRKILAFHKRLAVAALYGMSYSAIREISTGHTWGDV